MFYGTHPWHWYVSNAVPTIFAAHLPFIIYGVYLTWNTTKVPLIAATWFISIFSCLAHKEFRFIYPVLPLLLPYAGYTAAKLAIDHPRMWYKLVLPLFVVLNVSAGVYFNSVHQRGVLDAVKWLSEGPSVDSVGFLMPCHSTPYYASLHKDVKMWFLTCEPPHSISSM